MVYITKQNIKKQNSNWPQNPDHLCRIIIIEDPGSGKPNALYNLINHKLYTD